MTRREMIARGMAATALLASPLAARNRIDRGRISAITDEVGLTPSDSIEFAKTYGLRWVELRNVPGTKKEYMALPEPELKETAASFAANGLRVSFLNTSLMKFGWPGTEPLRRRPETDEARENRLAAEKLLFDRHLDDLAHALRAAQILGVDKVRVFTGSRVANPKSEFARIAEVLGEMARIAEKSKVHLLVENESSQNVGTSAELADFMELVPSKWIGLNWDPHNALPLQEKPWPDGYEKLPKKRIMNVQIKAKGVMDNPERLDWKSILQALQKDGYPGEIGLETHIFDGTLIQAANISMKEILHIVGEL